MFRPAAWFVGLRYTRAKRRNHFISFISVVSMIGIALGITVLITVLSVMNGFDKEIRERVFSMLFMKMSLRPTHYPLSLITILYLQVEQIHPKVMLELVMHTPTMAMTLRLIGLIKPVVCHFLNHL